MSFPADFRPTADWTRLRLRADLLRRLRYFFAERHFLEVETPVLSADTVIDRHLDPIPVALGRSAGEPSQDRSYFLQTSPEFGMKRLLAAGGGALYQVSKVFRLGERGPLHNPEFTMVEWYRAGDDYEAGMTLLAELAASLLGRGVPERISYAEAFREAVGVDAIAASTAEIVAAAQRQAIVVPDSIDPADRDVWLDLLLVECVQPRLVGPRPFIVYDFPHTQAALAQVRPGPPPVAERFELYVDGMELANGYHELLRPDELRKRNSTVNTLRQADGKPSLPEESRLLAAMEAGLPPCAGVALGFDRLVMIAAGAQTIDEVIAFPFERA